MFEAERSNDLLLMLVKKQPIPKWILEPLQCCCEWEVIMDRLGKPSEEWIREWMIRGAAPRHSPLDPAEARRQRERQLREQKYQEWRLRLV